MAINRRVRRMLNQKGVELVRAKFIIAMGLNADTDDDAAMQKEISFGRETVKVSDLAEWLANEAKNNARSTKRAESAAATAAFLALLTLVVAVLAWAFPDFWTKLGR
jgi:hypothetical protein